MSENDRETAITWARLFIGSLLFAAMLYIHVAIKELPYWMYLFPGFLMGMRWEKLPFLKGNGK